MRQPKPGRHRPEPDPNDTPNPERSIVVCGSRDWDDENLITTVLSHIPRDVEVITGGAYGADYMANRIARELGFTKRKIIHARWNDYRVPAGSNLKNPAGLIRNREMLDLEPNKVIAFRRHDKRSTGTAHCVTEARKRGIITMVFSSAMFAVDFDEINDKNMIYVSRRYLASLGRIEQWDIVQLYDPDKNVLARVERMTQLGFMMRILPWSWERYV